MNCVKCGTSNMEGVKFCVKCGNPFVYVNNQEQKVDFFQNQMKENVNVNRPNAMDGYIRQSASVTESASQPNNGYSTTVSLNQNSNHTNTNENLYQNGNYSNVVSKVQVGSNNASFSIMEYLFILLAVLLKPYTAFKEELRKFDNIKKPMIAGCIISLITTIATFLKTVFSVVLVRTPDIQNGGVITVWKWENLKEIPYIQMIFKNFFVYFGIMVVIASVYYIVGLIAKKQLNFVRLFSISTLSSPPMFLCVFILSPIISLMNATLGLAISILGIIYTLVITYEMMNQELALNGNIKIYVNFVCLSILGIIMYYLYTKVFMVDLGNVENVENNIKDILNQFGY